MNLFHYTSEAGFKGSVLNRTLRLVQSTHSNDRRDTVHIHDLIKEDIESFYINEDIKDNQVIEMILNVFNKFEDERTIEGEQEKSEKAFVTCFTDKYDDRMLWTAYSDDKGYCLGFNTEKLTEYINLESTRESIFKIANTFYMTGVIYETEKQKSLIRNILRDEYQRFVNMPNDLFSEVIPELFFPYQLSFTDENGNEIYKGNPHAMKIRIREKYVKMSHSVNAKLLFISPLLKNDYWMDENETRLILYRPVQTKFLEPVKKDEKDRNYVEFKVPHTALNEVIIAPQNPKTVNEVKTDLINAGYDMTNVNVRYSKGKGVMQERGR